MVFLFDGHDDGAIQHAREQWKAMRELGYKVMDYVVGGYIRVGHAGVATDFVLKMRRPTHGISLNGPIVEVMSLWAYRCVR